MDWLLSLKEGDQLDIFDGDGVKLTKIEPTHCWNLWHIGRIKQIEIYNHTVFQINAKILVHYDGFSTDYDEWVNIKYRHYDYPRYIHHKLKPLHQMTPYHDKSANCGWKQSSKIYPCTKCKRICCRKCFVVLLVDNHNINVETKGNECVSLSQYQYLFNLSKLFYESIFKQNRMEINIIMMIANYSFNDFIECGNKIKDCPNKFDIKSEKKTLSHYINYNQNCFNINKQMIICKTCCISQKCLKYNEQCTSSIIHCKGIKCKKTYCDQCWISMTSNKCRNCKELNIGPNLLCDHCYNGASICSKPSCLAQICVVCKGKCVTCFITNN